MDKQDCGVRVGAVTVILAVVVVVAYFIPVVVLRQLDAIHTFGNLLEAFR